MVAKGWCDIRQAAGKQGALVTTGQIVSNKAHSLAAWLLRTTSRQVHNYSKQAPPPGTKCPNPRSCGGISHVNHGRSLVVNVLFITTEYFQKFCICVFQSIEDIQGYHLKHSHSHQLMSRSQRFLCFWQFLGSCMCGKALSPSPFFRVLRVSLCPSSVHLLESHGAHGICYFLLSLLHPICSEFRVGNKPLKGLLTVGVERVIPFVQSKCDVVIFESVSLSRHMTQGGGMAHTQG